MAATIVKSMQNEVAQCVRLAEVGAARNQVLVEKAKQSSLGREGQAIKSWQGRSSNKVMAGRAN